MTHLLKLFTAMAITATVILAQEIQIFQSENKDGKITPQTIGSAFEKAGLYISENRDMNVPFVKQFKESGFTVYNLATFFSKSDVLELVKTYPQIGLFAPMSMSIWTKKGETTISVSTLTPETMATIMGIPANNPTLQKIGEMIHEALKSAMPNGKFITIPYSPKPIDGKRVTTFEIEMDSASWEDAKEEFQMGFEGELSPNGFVMAGFNDLNYDFDEKNYEGFYFYDVYSICKLPVIYTVAKVRPEAGAFAPCSLYMYMKKGESQMKLGFPSVYNWISALSIDDKASLKELKDAQNRMEKILSSLTE